MKECDSYLVLVRCELKIEGGGIQRSPMGPRENEIGFVPLLNTLAGVCVV